MPKISELTVTTGLTTGDYFVIVQGGNSRKIKVDDFFASINLPVGATLANVPFAVKSNMNIESTLGNDSARNFNISATCTDATAESKLIFRTMSSNSSAEVRTHMSIFSSNSSVYFDGAISVASITDRTPIYEGDALKELETISGDAGKIDHQTLPAFMQKPYVAYSVVAGETVKEDKIGRSISGAVSMLITAVQQLSQGNKDVVASVNGLSCSMNDMDKSMKALDERIKAIEKPASTLQVAT